MMSKSALLANRVSKIGNSTRYFAKGKTIQEESNSNLNNVVGGYKATITNPNVSEQAKERAEGMLNRLEDNQSHTIPRNQSNLSNADLRNNDVRGSNYTQNANPNNVAGGYKATISNPNMSDVAKSRAEQALDNMGESSQTINNQNFSNSNRAHTSGYIPKSMTEQQLRNMEVTEQNLRNKTGHNVRSDLNQTSTSDNQFRGAYAKDRNADADPVNVAGGFKATISNPKTSEEAKARAEQALSGMGELPSRGAFDSAPRSSFEKNYGTHQINQQHNTNLNRGNNANPDISEFRGTYAKDKSSNVNPNNVAGGYKATLSNPHTSEQAKAHAQQVLSEMGETNAHRSNFSNTHHINISTSDNASAYNKQINGNLDGNSEFRGAYAKDKSGAVNFNNVAGGYKATITNPNTSEESKVRAEHLLAEMGETHAHRDKIGYETNERPGYKANHSQASHARGSAQDNIGRSKAKVDNFENDPSSSGRFDNKSTQSNANLDRTSSRDFNNATETMSSQTQFRNENFSSSNGHDEAMLTTAEQRARGSIPENNSGYTLGEDVARQRLMNNGERNLDGREGNFRNNMEDAKSFANRK